MKQLTAVTLIILFLVLLFSCSGSPPELDELKWRVILRDDGSDQFEQLMLFFRFTDPDGNDDLASATVLAEGTGLLWNFNQEIWSTDDSGGRWWGLPPMASHTGGRLPDARYIIRLEDLAGRTVEMQFRPDPKRQTLDTVQWPEVTIENSTLQFPDSYPGAVLNLRDINGFLINSYDGVNGISIDLTNAESWEVWIPLEDISSGFLMGPYPLELFHTE